MRKWLRSVILVVFSFAISFLAGWAYLTWDIYPVEDYPEITDAPATAPEASPRPPEAPPTPDPDPTPTPVPTPAPPPTPYNPTGPTEITSCPLPEDYSEYGLLLGLSGDSGGHRTLWIRPYQGALICSEIPDAIVFPYREGFGWMKNVQRLIGPPGSPGSPSLTLSKLLFGPLGEDADEMSVLLEPFSEAQPYWDDRADSTDALYYVGDGYVCYVNQYYTGGDQSAWYYEYARTVPLESVNLFAPHTEAEPSAYIQSELIDLNDLLDSNLLRSLHTLSDFTYGFETRSSLDFQNMVLAHNRGRWHLSVPVFRRRMNTDNNGGSAAFERFLPLGIDLPESLTGFHDWPEGMEYSQLLWSEYISDAVAAPDFGAFVALSVRAVDVLGREGRLDSPLLSVNSRLGERIVSVRWAAPQDMEEWEISLAPYFNEKPLEGN